MNTRESFCDSLSPGAPGCSVEMFDELAIVTKIHAKPFGDAPNDMSVRMR